MAPEKYNHWYHSQYGSWVGQVEFSLVNQLMQPYHNCSLLDVGCWMLDVGCGTGYFSRKYAALGLRVTGIDIDPAMIQFAIVNNHPIHYLIGDALDLPFNDEQFSYCSAITSLCFINNPQRALKEMWRVCKKGMAIGLLNRNSLLYLQKANKGNYTGVRWDTINNVQQWIKLLKPKPSEEAIKTALFILGIGIMSRKVERLFSNNIYLGGFLAIYLKH